MRFTPTPHDARPARHPDAGCPEGPWQDERQRLGKHSLLRLTHGTLLNPPPTVDAGDRADGWDENRIRSRGSYLASLSLHIWPSGGDLLAG
ncbi:MULTISPECIES: hypothetical protein [unclassified Streptomyces]|uniref:hypothetical protein n=1 Tax=unclassified Streptomyces TaxID=2593676 RepID=UPI000A1D6E8F|nr:hypothetical protein [Streptomyces sp. 13-12-16]OSP44872.1 hypothetical protein B7767_02570 [Streptomyces sp. 13-12-16]